MDDRRGKCGFGAAKRCMDAVQRLRAKAQGTGNLKTGSEQKVETKTTQSGQQVIVVEQANPEAVYVPSYDPEVVYGAAPAEYPYILTPIPDTSRAQPSLGERPSPWVAYGPTTGEIAIGMTVM